MRRAWCWIRGKAKRLVGVRWSGHCWEGTSKGVYCVDCGLYERMVD